MIKDIVLDKKTYGNARIAVALSGGRDSIALIHAMQVAGIKIFAVNVEHGIRGESSLSDSRFVADFCKQADIELKAFTVDAPTFSMANGYTLEQGARILRYGIFQNLLDSGECEYVALAHHASDQTETVFMRVLRGTGIKGLGGMAGVNGKYIRPLLGYTRDDINSYVKKNLLPFVEDESNADDAFTRNYIREQISVFRRRFPNIDAAVARLVRSAREAEEYIYRAAGEPLIDGDEVKIPCAALSEPATAKRLIMKVCSALGVYQDIEERHFEIVLGLNRIGNGKRVALAHGIIAHKDGDFIVFTRDPEFSDLQNSGLRRPNAGAAEGKIKGGRFIPAEKLIIEKGALYADAGKIPSDAVFRHRKDGDRFRPYGGGEKSLGDYLTDKKIPLRKRAGLVVLASGKEILAIEGVEISDKIKVDGDTKKIVKILFKEA